MKTTHPQFETFLKTQLNSKQQAAVRHANGPILVVAGAGSGKTRVITARICHLIITKDVPPACIIALTFTNKAAREMKERIKQTLPSQTQMPFVGTFHSYCLRLLKINAALLDTPQFAVMDSADQEKLLTSIIKKVNVTKKVSAKSLTYTISQIKTARALDNSYEIFDPFISSVCEQYEQTKKASHCFDFDDLLLEALKLFQKNKTFKTQFQAEIKHILVDEYQDTNAVQHALLKQMALKDKKQLAVDSICVVGDEDQSIYSWRGATVDNILNFTKDFTKTKTVTIEQNYRSVKQILDIANNVIKHNTKRNPKKLWSDKAGSGRALIMSALSGYQESDILAACAQTARASTTLNSVAILYRTHFQSRIIEEALLRNSIPYKIIGGIQFYERKEIKDLLAYLRLIINPFDRVSFARVINTPNRGLGDKFQETFFTAWDQEPLLNCKDVGQKLIEQKLVRLSRATAVKSFLALLCSEIANKKPTALLETIIRKTGYIDYLKKQYEKEEAQAKIDNVNEFLRALLHFEQQGVQTTQAILEEIALMQAQMSHQDEQEQCIQLMTLHAAKGLEFDLVMITGLEEGLLPSSRSLHDSDAVEEERRLFYVGITRARERLVLTHSKFRHTYGTMNEQVTSRFADEVPSSLVRHEDCAYWKQYKMVNFFQNWLGITNSSSLPLTFGPARIPDKPKKQPTFSTRSAWRKYQPVKHASFGIGVVQKIEKKSSTKTYLTIKFKTGIKKIDAQFVQRV